MVRLYGCSVTRQLLKIAKRSNRYVAIAKERSVHSTATLGRTFIARETL
jgi:hypothetical protein